MTKKKRASHPAHIEAPVPKDQSHDSWMQEAIAQINDAKKKDKDLSPEEKKLLTKKIEDTARKAWDDVGEIMAQTAPQFPSQLEDLRALQNQFKKVLVKVEEDTPEASGEEGAIISQTAPASIEQSEDLRAEQVPFEKSEAKKKSFSLFSLFCCCPRKDQDVEEKQVTERSPLINQP